MFVKGKTHLLFRRRRNPACILQVSKEVRTRLRDWQRISHASEWQSKIVSFKKVKPAPSKNTFFRRQPARLKKDIKHWKTDI